MILAMNTSDGRGREMTTDTKRSRLYALTGIAAALVAALTINTVTRSPAEARASDRTIALAISHGDGLPIHMRGAIQPDQRGPAALICSRVITTPFARVGIGCQRTAATSKPARFAVY